MNLVQKLIAAFGFIVLVMIILTVSVSVSLTGMRDANNLTNHTMQIMNDADDIVKHLLSIDSGQRGYVITNNKDFLLPYDEGKAGVEKNMKSLRQLVSDNPQQLKRLDEVREIYEDWLENAIDPAIQLRAIGLEQASNFVARGEGKDRMENLQGVLDEFIATEQGVLTQRSEDAADAYHSGGGDSGGDSGNSGSGRRGLVIQPSVKTASGYRYAGHHRCGRWQAGYPH